MPTRTVVGWGRNNYGQANVPADPNNVVAIAAGDYHSLALKADGIIGPARHFAGNQGIFGGDHITAYPGAGSPHSSEAWFRAEKPDSTLLGWGNEQAQGKVVLQFRSPPHVRTDCYFSDGNVAGASRLSLGEWTHVVHTYEGGEARIYVNGTLDGLERPSLL